MSFASRLASTALAWVALCSATPAAETVRIQALDCIFEIPADYEISVAPNSAVTLSAPGDFLGARIRISELDSEFPSTELFKSLGRVAIGPLSIERFSNETRTRTPSPVITFTIVRGRHQQARFDAMPDAKVDGHVSQCLKSMNPAVLAAAERKSAGCASTVSLQDVTAALGEGVRAQPVFADGGLKGWRVYGTSTSAQLSARGMGEGSMMTHVCGMPAREMFVNEASACCAADASKKFDVTFRRSGEEIQLSIARDPARNSP